MTPEFDYEEFALSMFEQSKPLIPKDLTDIQKSYISNIVLNCTKRAGEALYRENNSNFSTLQKKFIAQAIAEWSFHKAIDSVKAGIPCEYIDWIIESIAFIAFGVTKQGFLNDTPENKILRILEIKITKTYREKILELQKAKCIDEKMAKNALQQSNIDVMMGRIFNKAGNGWSSIPK